MKLLTVTHVATTEKFSMKAKFYKMKWSLDLALHLQDFLHSTYMINSLMTVYLYMLATQLYDWMEYIKTIPINLV